ncbi:MAG: HAD hydrolase-like protein [Bacteroidia bacterium]|nr:HAD hydrolase-like protein [Bacteroidia bacterium]NNJ55857.1 HAD family hydrolase [Bacteroidia bacterium]
MNYDLRKYKNILWDFDGVIMDSMEIRDSGFLEIFKDFPNEQVEELMNFHRTNGGWSRYVKIEHFLKNIVKTECSKEIIADYAAQFSSIMLKLLVNPDFLIADSLNYIKSNQHINYHIVSGSDGTELNHICKELGLNTYFLTINGSPTAKIELVSRIIKKYNYNIADTCLIGDSINDFEAANENNIDFYGYNNPDLLENHKVIDSFQN